MPGHDRRVVHPAAVAVELEPVVEDPLDVVERVRPLSWRASSTRLQISSSVVSSLSRSSWRCSRSISAERRVPRRSLTPESCAAGRGGRARLPASPAPRRAAGAGRGSGAARVAGRSRRRGRSGGSTRPARSRRAASRASSARRRAGRRTTSARRARRGSRRRGSRSSRAHRLSSDARCTRDERAAGFVQLSTAHDRLGQLHQREDPLLHARAARRGDRDERTPPSAARSQARANFSPTTLPIEPPMNEKSIDGEPARRPSIAARPISIASPGL